MHKHLSFAISLILLIAFSFTATSQQWTDNLPQKSEDYTLFEYQKAFNDYWEPYNVENGYYIDANGEKQKAPSWKLFKRWEYYNKFRVDPVTGEFPDVNRIDIFNEEKNTRNGSGSRNATGTWIPIGPNTSTGGYHGIGRINTIGFREGDANTLYAGSPAGGLWKSTNGGANWTVLTDDNASLGVSDVVVKAGATTASDIVLIGTGDKDGGGLYNLKGGQSADNNGIGVLKSIDGGSTWSTTDMVFAASENKRVSRLLVDPNNANVILASIIGSAGEIYKSTDLGSTWTKIADQAFIDMEFKPGSSSIIYGSTTYSKIYKSTDGGATWTLKHTATGGGRAELAVSAAEPNSVWLVGVSSATRGLDAIYKSTDSGETWPKIFIADASGKYLLGYNCDASDNKGQGEYDLCLAVDPGDASKIYLGGVNLYRSTTGGSSWTISSHWSNGPPACTNPAVTTVHADQHFIGVQEGTNHVYVGNDGGVYKSEDHGVSWLWRGNGLAINQIYRLSVAKSISNHYLTGSQDNGTKRYNGAWDDAPGGDGADNAIHPTNVNLQYGSNEKGKIYRTYNSWATSTVITDNIAGDGDWISPFVIDPNTPSTIYLGYKTIHTSYDGGTSWAPPFPNFSVAGVYDAYIHSIAIAPSNSSYIYVGNEKYLRRTTDGGTNWVDITAGLPTTGASPSNITYISVSDTDPDKVWVSLGQYNEHGVYETTDGGANWTDISTGLPEIPVMCVIQNKQDLVNDQLYAATDVGVYVKEGDGNWSPYSNGLPNVVVSELEIYYDAANPGSSKLLAATYGRGVWESDLLSITDAPVANFSADNKYPSTGQTVAFTDESTLVPTAWLWEFTPNTVVITNGDGTVTNPEVQFTAEGEYEVKLTATNAIGSDVETKKAYINVSNLPVGYCNDAKGDAAFAPINRVSLLDIDNNTNYSAGGYGDFTATQSTRLEKGGDVVLHIKSGLPNTGVDFSAYIDWNRDGSFDDNEEQVACGSAEADGTQTFNIHVPAWANTGKTRMRVRSKFLNSDCAEPCGSVANGEVEDYSIVLVDGVATLAPVAAFSADNVHPTTTQVVQFSDQSLNLPSGYTWTFDPSATVAYETGFDQNSANPQVKFTTEGTYQVSLLATNAIGNDTETKVGYITVSNLPTGYCTPSSGQYGAISQVTFGTIDNNSDRSTTGYSDFTYLTNEIKKGEWQAIKIYNFEGGEEDVTAWVDWDRSGTFEEAERVGCVINGGTGFKTFHITAPVTAATGKTVLRVRSKHYGSDCPTPCGFIQNGETEDYSVFVEDIGPTGPPVADFSADLTIVNPNTKVILSNHSTQPPNTFVWTITPGTYTYVDGTGSTSANPAVEFTTIGNYTVSLEATNTYSGGSSDTETKTDYIEVDPVAYCDAGSQKGSIGIKSVSVGTLNHNDTLIAPFPHYADNTGVNPTGLKLNTQYAMSFKFEPWPQAQIDGFVWIDYNRDGDFTDVGELVYYKIDDGTNVQNFNFTVPATATPGATRMRLRSCWSGTAYTSPCGSTEYGEVLDYTVRLTDDITWTGTTSTDWSVTTNWDKGIVPTANYNVIIPSAPTGGRFPVINVGTNAECHDINLEDNARLDVDGTLELK